MIPSPASACSLTPLTLTADWAASSLQIDSVEPFYVEPKLPLEVTSGDRIRLPIAIVNSTDADMPGARFVVTADSQIQPRGVTLPFTLRADARLRRLLELTVGSGNGPAQFTLNATAGPYADKVTRSLVVKPRGFPIEVGHGGLIAPGDTVSHELSIPDDLVPRQRVGQSRGLSDAVGQHDRSARASDSRTVRVLRANQLDDLPAGHGTAVFHVASRRRSRRSSTAAPRFWTKATTGCSGFECKSGGFEWFGSDPGHDALTAYGLMEFTDMSQVRHVDPQMLERTRKWLLGQRDGKGGFARKTHTLHTWLAEPEIANAYNTWGLLEAGIDADLATEVKWIREAAERTENTYVMALAANVMSLAGEKEGEEHLLDKLAGKQSDDGSLVGATRSVVGSGGEALKIETTSLAVLAWLRNPHYQANVEKSIKYLAESCKAGRFGSTQSTVLALRAIVAYDQSRATPESAGHAAIDRRRQAGRRPGQVRQGHAGRDRVAGVRRTAYARQTSSSSQDDRRLADALLGRSQLQQSQAGLGRGLQVAHECRTDGRQGGRGRSDRSCCHGRQPLERRRSHADGHYRHSRRSGSSSRSTEGIGQVREDRRLRSAGPRSRVVLAAPPPATSSPCASWRVLASPRMTMMPSLCLKRRRLSDTRMRGGRWPTVTARAWALRCRQGCVSSQPHRGR